MPDVGYGSIKTDFEGLAKIAQWKGIIEARAGTVFITFQAIEYATEPAAGTNFKSKIKVGEGIYIHAVVLQSIDQTAVQCTSVEQGKGHNDPLLG